MKLSDQNIRTLMAVLIAVLWAIGYLIAIISSNYEGVIPATPVMLIASAYLFGGSEIARKRKEDRNGGT